MAVFRANWRNPSEYPPPGCEDHAWLAWEFIRRHPDYAAHAQQMLRLVEKERYGRRPSRKSHCCLDGVECWPAANKGETAKNVRLLKYSDILLVRAEAAHHINQLDTALSIVNKIRNRAGLIPLTSVTLDQIYKERRLEMAMEHDRWFDIVRTGKASASMSAVGKVFIQGKHELFPIPEEQITLSKGILTQNPNYN